jgi:YHS domain-containing protein
MLRIILIAILLIIVARLFWRVIDGIIEGVSGRPLREVRGRVKLQRDPVCGTYVAPGSALSLTAGGTTQYFCSEKCRNEYLAR